MKTKYTVLADEEIFLPPGLMDHFCTVHTLASKEISVATVADVDILLLRSVTPVNNRLLEKCSKLRLVGSATSGIDHVDTTLLQQRGIDFINTPGANAQTVVEYVLGCLCMFAKKKSCSLTDFTLAIVGRGNVGGCLQRVAQKLGIHCLVNDPPLQFDGVDDHWSTLEECCDADVISLHVPLNHEEIYPTCHLINAALLERFSSEKLLINTARSEVIDEAALLQHLHLQKNTLHTVIDVWSTEPVVQHSLLAATTIATPHIAGYSIEAKQRAGYQLAAAVAKWCHECLPENITTTWNQEKKIHLSECTIDKLCECVLQNQDLYWYDCELRRTPGMSRNAAILHFNRLRRKAARRHEILLL